MIIYFTGLDGSGKSTLIKEFIAQIGKDEQVEVVWGRYSPKLVKVVIKIIKRNVTKAENYNHMDANDYSSFKEYKKKITRSILIKKLIFALQVSDYFWQIKMIEKKMKSNKSLLIVDRYIIDFLVDQTINFGNINKWFFTKYLMKRLNKVDKIIFVDTKADVAFKRKNDIPSMEYLLDRISAFDDILSIIPNIYKIDNSGSIEDGIKQLENILGK